MVWVDDLDWTEVMVIIIICLGLVNIGASLRVPNKGKIKFNASHGKPAVWGRETVHPSRSH